jgi:APA family basic amino acid/polyamine antiporter
VLVGLSAVWSLTLINIGGVRRAGFTQLITTLLKLVPLLMVIVMGLLYLNRNHFIPFNRSGGSPFSAITATAALTLWAFLGLESASIPADSIRNPHRNIPRATILGTGFTAGIYILSTIAVMGILPADRLAQSSAPFARAAIQVWGPWAGDLIAVGAAISCLGALNGWILLQGQIPRAVALDGLFPRVFSRLNRKRAPWAALIFSSGLVTLLLLMNYSRGLVEQFTFIIMLATFTCLIPYLFCSLSELMIYRRDPRKTSPKRLVTSLVLSIPGFAYSLWAILGLQGRTVFWGILLLTAGLPVYWLGKSRAVSRP